MPTSVPEASAAAMATGVLVPWLHQGGHQDRREGQIPRHRQIDLAGDDDECLTDRDHADEGADLQQIADVVPGGIVRIDRRSEREQHDQQDIGDGHALEQPGRQGQSAFGFGYVVHTGPSWTSR